MEYRFTAATDLVTRLLIRDVLKPTLQASTESKAQFQLAAMCMNGVIQAIGMMVADFS